jgi:uncharacterized LabA/DUF88 family protein
MDLLYSGRFDAFVLVTSDSDFTSLASRLRASQIFVFGVGEQKTPIAFRNACDDFILTDVLLMNDDEEEEEEVKKKENNGSAPEEKEPASNGTRPATRQTRNELRSNTKLVAILRKAVAEYADDDGWAQLSPAGSLIKRQFPDFDPRRYGYATLLKLINATELFDTQREGNGQSGTVYLRDKRAK